MKRLLCVALSLSAGSAAWAQQPTPVGPFAGPYRESFETQPVGLGTQYSCLPGRIFNNSATICEPTSNSLVIPATWSMFCTAVPHQGSRYAVGAAGWLEITFDVPVTRFGGYFATIGGIDGGEIAFFNAQGGTVGAAAFGTNQCQWTWRGWSTAAPFSRVRIWGMGNFGSGGYLHMDDLEYQRQGGQQPCYANCDGSAGFPLLTGNDFQCFLDKFATGQAYANCDGSVVHPVLNANDFQCFLDRFAAGCQ